ncbi:replication terminator protein [Alicyclobacillus dauci]|uniref:Replication terminator protein n=1 Tax=Alicyclobacillus dauci TaxID=1475485 RepID=A0ABY6Z6S0_9BACL|nr:replication terminator protein [Alicyclobacillus dauci]WAH38584.1 replication terminator protein [Alicyclobacillus dauci]
MDLAKMAGGAVQERFDTEFQRVLDNIMDPNTSTKAKRKLQLTLTFATDENREIALVTVDAKSTIAPAVGIATKFLMDRDLKGRAVGAEFTQARLFEEAEVAPSEPGTGKVSYLEQKQSGGLK